MNADVYLAMTFGAAAATMPGPFTAFLFSHSLTHGWKRTFPAAFAPLLTDGPIAFVVILLLSQVPDSFVRGLQLFGALFILYLAVETGKAFWRFDPEEVVSEESGSGSLWRGVGINIINPGAYLGWSLVLGPLVIKAWQQSPMAGLGVILGFYIPFVSSLLALVLLFSLARNLGAKVNRVLLGVSTVALAGFGIYQLWLVWKGFIPR